MLVTKLMLLLEQQQSGNIFCLQIYSRLSSGLKLNFYLYVHLNIEIFLYV